MPDKLTDDESEAIARYLADHEVTRINYMLDLPLEQLRRPNTTWGKAKKGVRPIKRVVKR